jgi:thioredoxin-related protein
MIKYYFKNISAILFFITTFIVSACVQNINQGEKTKTAGQLSTVSKVSERKYKVTFIELGSVRCIPCQQMQSVMKSIETKYGKEVKVDFHDVWTDAGKPFGIKYAIEAIPTQVFLDETGKEYYRHVGFFPEEELVKILQMKGVKMN